MLWLANNGRSRTLPRHRHTGNVGAVAGQQRTLTYTPWPVDVMPAGAVAGQQRTLTYTLAERVMVVAVLWLANNGRSRTLACRRDGSMNRLWLANNGRSRTLRLLEFLEGISCGWPTTDAHVHWICNDCRTVYSCGWPTTDAHVHYPHLDHGVDAGCGWPTTDAHVH